MLQSASNKNFFLIKIIIKTTKHQVKPLEVYRLHLTIKENINGKLKEHSLVRDLPHPSESSGRLYLLNDVYSHTIFANVQNFSSTVKGHLILRKTKLNNDSKPPIKKIKFLDEKLKKLTLEQIH